MSDWEMVGWVAKVLGISDYDVFHRAAKEYGPRMEALFENHFTKYILTGQIPFYVRSYCRIKHTRLRKEERYGNG